MLSDWSNKPRTISVVTDNDGWQYAHSEKLVARLKQGGDHASLVRDYGEVKQGHVAFYLGCLRITPPEVLKRNELNLVVHASDLPKGRGFSPLTWLILEGRNKIPVCLIEAADEVDAGAIYYKDWITFDGHELIDELRHAVAEKSSELCLKIMNSKTPPTPMAQSGEATYYAKRNPEDSQVDPHRTLIDLFNQFRVADNEAYPVTFRHLGRTYVLKIDKVDK